MIQIRKGIFETNSSSTHAICVSKEKPNIEDVSIYGPYQFEERPYCFSRCESRLVDDFWDKLAYVYITVYTLSNESDSVISGFEKSVEHISEKYYTDDKYHPYNTKKLHDFLKSIEKEIIKGHAFVDHTEGLRGEFYERLINDQGFLERLLFNDESYITIGGDEYRGYNIKTIGFEYDYHYPDDTFEKKLDEYRKGFDVYLKGN